MCDEKPWKLVMNTRGNSEDIDSSSPKLRQRCYMCDENLWQLVTKFRRYCHDAQNAIFFRRTIVDIVTMEISFFFYKLHEIWYYHITL
jgi:hypothetical protein